MDEAKGQAGRAAEAGYRAIKGSRARSPAAFQHSAQSLADLIPPSLSLQQMNQT